MWHAARPLITAVGLLAAVASADRGQGVAYAWGLNDSGQTGVGNTNTPVLSPTAVSGLGSGVTAVSGGNLHSVAVVKGAAYAWGRNANGRLGLGTTTSLQPSPVAIPVLSSGVTAVSGGGNHSLVLAPTA